MKHLRATIYEADSGKVFRNKNTLAVGCELILIGNSDCIDNYEEIDKPEPEETETPKSEE